MKTKIIILFIGLNLPFGLKAQETKQAWSLNDCIEHALTQNIQVRKSILTNINNELNANQAVNNKLPSVNASIRQNFSWGKVTDPTTGSDNFKGDNSSNYSVNANMVLYNGSRLSTLVKQAELDMQKGIFDSETIKASISLSILNAYLQVLYAEEQVNNAEKQLESTTEQLNLAQERLNLSIISRSDFLQVKSQLASEKLNLANTQSQYAIAKITLMQLIDLPVDEDFSIVYPELNEPLNNNLVPYATNVYNTALGIKPEIKSATYQKESAALNQKVAKSGYLPTLSVDAGVGTGYSYLINTGYFGQLQDRISPSVGLTLSIPIFQKEQVRTNVSIAKINYQNAELLEIDTKNQLRKEIEQACVDVVSAQTKYEASREKLDATEESYTLAEEKYKNGLINSVDFLFEKTNLIVAESDYLQSKYNLIFSYKTLDFYTGTPITL